MSKKQVILNKHLNGVEIGNSNEAILNAMTEFAKLYHKKQLTLTDVSQQRELLSQYNDYLNMQYQSSGYDDTDISDFFEWLNCG
tara:strand:- start:370 stop:621 length:252 start_codon:yes stop_codon:yes gene_type:complete